MVLARAAPCPALCCPRAPGAAKDLQFKVGFDGSKVELSINGLAPQDIFELSVPELIAETLVRTQRFATDALLLLTSTSRTDERLRFQAAALDGLLAGLGDAGYKAPLAAMAEPRGSMFGRLFALPNSAGDKPSTSGGEAPPSQAVAVSPPASAPSSTEAAEQSVASSAEAEQAADVPVATPASQAGTRTSVSALVRTSP